MTDDDGIGGPSQPVSNREQGSPQRISTPVQLFRRILRGQQVLATLIGVIRIPTVILTGYSAALSLKPEVLVTLASTTKAGGRSCQHKTLAQGHCIIFVLDVVFSMRLGLE